MKNHSSGVIPPPAQSSGGPVPSSQRRTSASVSSSAASKPVASTCEVNSHTVRNHSAPGLTAQEMFPTIPPWQLPAWSPSSFAQVEPDVAVRRGHVLGAEALLLGRRTYEFFAARWPSRSGELADRLNSMPKYVVSSTLADPDWKNSTVLKGDAVREISRLKHELDGDIMVLASFQIVHALMEQELVDELRLKLFPVVLGAGERLFGGTSDKRPMRLVDSRAVDNGVAVLTYVAVRDS